MLMEKEQKFVNELNVLRSKYPKKLQAIRSPADVRSFFSAFTGDLNSKTFDISYQLGDCIKYISEHLSRGKIVRIGRGALKEEFLVTVK